MRRAEQQRGVRGLDTVRTTRRRAAALVALAAVLARLERVRPLLPSGCDATSIICDTVLRRLQAVLARRSR